MKILILKFLKFEFGDIYIKLLLLLLLLFFIYVVDK